jgi:hypothetical protein
VREEDGNERHPAQQRERVEQVEEPTVVLDIAVGRLDQGHPAHDVGERHAPQKRGQERTEHDGHIPVAPPAAVRALAAVLEGDPAQDQRDEDQEQRQVEAAEQRGVPLREGGERRTAGHEHPDLVAVPDRAQRGDDSASLGLVLAHDRQQHADAEVEPLEDEVADPEDGDEDEPDSRQFHDLFLSAPQ